MPPKSKKKAAAAKKSSQPPKAIKKQISRVNELEREMAGLRASASGRGRNASALYRRPRPSMLGDFAQFAGDSFSKVFGLGAYKMRQNSLFDVQTQSQVPAMHSSSESVVFRHREYITDINTQALYVSQSFPINPGLQTTFPYLSTIAQQFQEYEFRGLIFEFKSTSGDAIASSSSALGSIAMCIQYRADAQPPLDKQALLNEMWAVDAKPSVNTILPVECSPAENPYAVQYVRSNTYTGDIKMYDIGLLTIATSGAQATFNAGELWASYEVVLRKPVVTGYLDLAGNAGEYYSSAYSNAAPMGSLNPQTPLPGGLSNWVSIDSTGTILTFSVPGTFLVSWNWNSGSNVSLTGPIVTGSSGSTNQGALQSPSSGTAGTNLNTTHIWQNLGTAKWTLTLSGGLSLPAGGVFRLYIAQLSSLSSSYL
jgi:hypothetical protein